MDIFCLKLIQPGWSLKMELSFLWLSSGQIGSIFVKELKADTTPKRKKEEDVKRRQNNEENSFQAIENKSSCW